MDIIASHQLGLIEQLSGEAVALAGRGRDGAQRALVYHHVAHMMGLAHGYALLAARGALAIDPAVAAMERAERRAWWRMKRGERAALALRVADFGLTLRAIDAERCAGLLMAYRLVATPGLSGEADRRLDPELLVALRAAQSTRGQVDPVVRHTLFAAHQRWADRLFGARIETAVAALDWPLAGRAMRQAIEALHISTTSFARAERHGMARVEAKLRRSKRLPAAFAANPAQAFFQLQRHLAAQRRRGADRDDLTPDEAVSLAA
ncbi:MAG: hypothetical protein M3Q88_04975 [Pseudomonadota bacterium]|nr:hypothetical protein [Pseudomonadota bacterium]